MRRFLVLLAALLTASLGTVAVDGGPASAAVGSTQCPATYLQTFTQRACVYWSSAGYSGNTAVVYIHLNDDLTIWGEVYTSAVFESATVYVEQCDGLGHNCV